MLTVFLCWFINKTRLSSFWLCGRLVLIVRAKSKRAFFKFQSRLRLILKWIWNGEEATTRPQPHLVRSCVYWMNIYWYYLKQGDRTKVLKKDGIPRSFKEKGSKVRQCKRRDKTDFIFKKPNLSQVDCTSDSVITVTYEEKGDNNNGDYSQSISELFPEPSTTTTKGIIWSLQKLNFKSGTLTVALTNAFFNDKMEVKMIKLNHSNRYIHFLCHYM